MIHKVQKIKTTPAMQRKLRAIERTLAPSKNSAKNPIPLPLKLRTAEILLRVKAHHPKPFGLMLILGWQNKWRSYTVVPDASQDIFAGHNINGHHPSEAARENYKGIKTTLLFDGAILINSKGKILHSGVMIEGLRPHKAAAKLNPGKFKDLSAQFGFKEKVHTRHLTAITASYVFKGTTVFTISEESGKMHIFENGKILYDK